MMPTVASRILRRIYPTITSCPACGAQGYKRAGSRGPKCYRRCKACGEVYPVPPAAVEYDLGGKRSVIQQA